ncbi:MAG: DUF4097 domain-containing protein [Anaerolineae bacterium]|nr:DUF4097 domain-containing protein [Anaerolineae bacterium]
MNDHRGWWIALLILALLICCCCALAWATGTLVLRGVRAGVAAIAAEQDDWQSWLRSLQERAEEWRDSFGIWPGTMTVSASETFTREVNVAGPATLELEATAGDVTIRPGPAGKVTVTAVKRAYGVTQAAAERRVAEMAISVDQAGDKVWVRVDNPFTTGNVGRLARVDLTITVPQETALTAGVDVGRLRVTGLVGDVDIAVQVGEVILADVVPARELQVKTRVAGIDFAAPLAPRTRYEFITDVGKITLRLPADSAFQLDARSDIGDVNVEFPVVGRADRDLVIGKDVRGDVGQNPTTSLSVRSRVGEIVIKKER